MPQKVAVSDLANIVYHVDTYVLQRFIISHSLYAFANESISVSHRPRQSQKDEMHSTMRQDYLS